VLIGDANAPISSGRISNGVSIVHRGMFDTSKGAILSPLEHLPNKKYISIAINYSK
jgi:hypothetical protein